MFKFLFGGKAKDEPKIETQREVGTRALEELNAVLEGLDPKPSVTLDMASGQIEVTWPEQMPDEALALPAPEAAKEAADEATDKVKELADDVAEATKDAAETAATKAQQSADKAA